MWGINAYKLIFNFIYIAKPFCLNVIWRLEMLLMKKVSFKYILGKKYPDMFSENKDISFYFGIIFILFLT